MRVVKVLGCRPETKKSFKRVARARACTYTYTCTHSSSMNTNDIVKYIIIMNKYYAGRAAAQSGRTWPDAENNDISICTRG